MRTIVVFLAVSLLWICCLTPLAAQPAPCITMAPLTDWFAGSYPPGTASVRLQLTFLNSGGPMVFSGSTFQVWGVPSAVTPPFVVNAEPSGAVAMGETFSYDVTVQVDSLPSGDTGLGFRPVDQNFGTMSPGTAPLNTQSAVCVAGPVAPVPAVNGIGLAMLIAGVALAGLLLVRRGV